MILHGAMDRVITVPHAEAIFEGLGGEGKGVTKKIFEDAGHFIPMEKKDEFPKLIEEFVGKFAGTVA